VLFLRVRRLQPVHSLWVEVLLIHRRLYPQLSGLFFNLAQAGFSTGLKSGKCPFPGDPILPVTGGLG
jgi:hypothetical protein